jgi:hypothetical protein
MVLNTADLAAFERFCHNALGFDDRRTPEAGNGWRLGL